MSSTIPPRIGYVTAMWQRPELTRHVFRHVAMLRESLAPILDLVPAVAGSEGDASRRIAEENGFLYAEIPNAPLGAKWNAALGLLKDRDVEGVCIFGSDDMANPAYFRCLLAHMDRGVELLGVRGLCFLDQATGRLAIWHGYLPPKERDTPGAGRFIRRRILDAMGWRLWPDDRPKWLDSAMCARIRERFGQETDFLQMTEGADDVAVLDVKSATVMTSFESILCVGNTTLSGRPHDFLRERFDGDAADALLPPEARRTGMDDIPLEDLSPRMPQRDLPKTRGVLHVLRDGPPLPSARDLLAACRRLGFLPRDTAPRELLLTPPTPRDILLAHPASLPALARTLHRQQVTVILDCHGVADPDLEIIRRLPFILHGVSGRPGDVACILPPPLSVPDRILPMEWRFGMLLCIGGAQEQAAAAPAISRLDARELLPTFCHDDTSAAACPCASLLGAASLPAGRQLFRILVFTKDAWPLASIPFAAGTPGICIGELPRGLEEGCGVLRVEDPVGAIAAARTLNRSPAIWKEAQARGLEAAARGHASFMEALGTALGQ